MADKVTIHALSQRFLEKDSDIPEKAEQIMYYSLAIGHHVGVLDCFKTVLECSVDEYKGWIDLLPKGDGQRKMMGLLKFNEIVIDSSHINLLGDAFVKIKDHPEKPYQEWTKTMLDLLVAMIREPAMYLMVKRRETE